VGHTVVVAPDRARRGSGRGPRSGSTVKRPGRSSWPARPSGTTSTTHSGARRHDGGFDGRSPEWHFRPQGSTGFNQKWRGRRGEQNEPGSDRGHYRGWLAACGGGGAADGDVVSSVETRRCRPSCSLRSPTPPWNSTWMKERWRRTNPSYRRRPNSGGLWRRVAPSRS
jgi:hypothetical protein